MVEQYPSEKIKAGIDTLVNTVKLTLGPKGHNVLLFDGAGKAFPTKDGITVASHIKSKDAAQEAAIQILREASSKTAELAGDGTTTTLVLAQALYNAGSEALKHKNLPALKAELNLAVKECRDLLKSSKFTRAIPFDKEHLAYVATTSANNDEEIGNLIADAFIQVGKEGTVTFDTEDVLRTYTEVYEGSRYKIPIVGREFINSKKSLEAKYDESYVLIFNNTAKDISNIAPAVRKAAKDNKPIVIFADDFSELCLSQLYANVVQNLVQVVPIRVVGYGGYKKDVYEDISVLTGAKVVDRVPNDEMLGKCDKISSSFSQTVITVNNPSPAFAERLSQIKETIKNEKDPVMKKQFKERLTQLQGRIATIHVGGATDAEQKERYDRVEDAVCAVNAALEEGISAGGGSTFVLLANEISELSKVLKSALLAPYTQLCINSSVTPKLVKITEDCGYNFLTDRFENLYNGGVIDPTKVIRLCIEHAVSVVMLLLSTEAIVYDEDDI